MDIDQHMKEKYGATLARTYQGFWVYESRHARYIVEQEGDRFTIYGYIGNFAENMKEQK